MSDTPKTLLPEGLRDLLPPDAAFEAEAVHRLIGWFGANGYELVKPPLVEFEDTLLAGVGAALRDEIFRMPDPVSHRTLGVRADVTTQVARVASTRLASRPRPLRLMYAGQVMRVRGDQLAPERQFTQLGIEIIGAPAGAADVEVILVTVDALRNLGIAGISVDLGLPTLVPAILSAMPANAVVVDRLRRALDQKDVTGIKSAGGPVGELMTVLAEASGPVAPAMAKVAQLPLSPAARSEWQNLTAIATAIAAAAPDLLLTLDLVESRGFEYHTGVTFSIFAKGAQREVGRGGRYRLSHLSGEVEDATGATLMVNSLLALVPPPPRGRRLWVPSGTARGAIRRWQEEGFSVVAGLERAQSPAAEARRLRCTHYLGEGKAVPIEDAS